MDSRRAREDGYLREQICPSSAFFVLFRYSRDWLMPTGIDEDLLYSFY